MNLNELRKLFTDSDKFPELECIKEDENEKNIKISEKQYLVLIETSEYPDYAEIQAMSPYVCINGTEKRYGWLDRDGNPMDNQYHPVKDLLFGEYIVGYKECGLKELEQLWKCCLDSIRESKLVQPYDIMASYLDFVFQGMFQLASNENFPEFECSIIDPDNKAVKTSESEYWCLIMDKRFNSEFVLKKLRPGTCKYDDMEELQYDWIDKEQNFIDNFIRSGNGDCWDQFVIAFAK